MATNKVQIIQDWPEPRKVKDIPILPRVRKLLPSLHLRIFSDRRPAHVAPPERVSFALNDECHSALVETLKKAFTSAPVLTHGIPDTPITVETNASNYALAAVLASTTSAGELHPVACHSCTFQVAEHNYDVTLRVTHDI